MKSNNLESMREELEEKKARLSVLENNENTTATEETAPAAYAVLNIPRAALLDALKATQYKDASLPILACVLISWDGLNVTMAGTDLESAVVISLPGSGDSTVSAFSFAVKRSALKASIQGAAKKSDVKLRYKPGALYVQWSTGTEIKLDAQDGAQYPVIPTFKTEEYKRAQFSTSAGKFKELVDAVIFCASKGDDRHFLTGANFTGEYIQVTDSRRLAVCQFPFDLKDTEPKKTEQTDKAEPAKEVQEQKRPASLIIPSASLKRAVKLTDHILSITATDNNVFFNAPGGYVVSRTIEGNFPAVDHVRAKSWTHIAALNGPALLSVLNSLPVVKGKGKESIKLRFSKAEMSAIYDGAEVYKAALSEGTFPEVFEISFNPEFVADILKQAADSVQMRFNGGTQPVTVFTGNEAEYLIMPLRTC
jgi:DNA polymerase III sliding clamp (beta) subunit (PCNA family)